MVRVIIASMLLAMLFSCSSAANETSDVENACNVTLHRALCIRTLAPFSKVAGDKPNVWARAGVSVTIVEAKRVFTYFTKLKENKHVSRGINGMAVSDCVDLIQDTLDILHESLYVLRNLSVASFETQIEDVITWVSAALTDEDTCLEGFDGRPRVWPIVNRRLSRVTNLTSNALALVTELASAGLQSLVNHTIGN